MVILYHLSTFLHKMHKDGVPMDKYQNHKLSNGSVWITMQNTNLMY